MKKIFKTVIACTLAIVLSFATLANSAEQTVTAAGPSAGKIIAQFSLLLLILLLPLVHARK